jgi:hypothetical protein
MPTAMISGSPELADHPRPVTIKPLSCSAVAGIADDAGSYGIASHPRCRWFRFHGGHEHLDHISMAIQGVYARTVGIVHYP